MNKTKLAVAMALLPFAVQAQSVPAIDKTALVVPMVDMAQPQIQLSAKERHALTLAGEWKNNPDKPRRSADGSVKYLFGATLPTLICTPLHVCVIRLQPGEVVNNVTAGDKTRWHIVPTTVGNGPMTITDVVVKPTESGLVTNAVISTDRRSYMILLKAAKHEWMPMMSFHYPDEDEQAWREYRNKQEKVAHASTMPTGENAASLDFGFRMSGDNPKWKPVRVYTDGAKTYIEFPSVNFNDEAPALVALGKEGVFSDAKTKIVNYRVIGKRYVADVVLDRAALISGVGGEQTRVTIERAEEK